MRRIGAFAVFVLLVAGCTSSADPGPSHTGSAPPSTPATTPLATASTPSGPATPTVPADVPTTGPNTNPGEKPPLEPLAATQHNPAGAKAFAVFFIKTIDWGYATTSAAYMRHYAAATCASCRSLITGLVKSQEAGHRFIGGRITVLAVRPGAAGPLAAQIVTVNMTSVEEVDRKHHFVRADVAHNGLRFEVQLRWTGSGWSVRELLVLQ